MYLHGACMCTHLFMRMFIPIKYQREVTNILLFIKATWETSGVSNLWPRMAMNAAQHKIINLIKRIWDLFVCVITCHNIVKV